MTGYNKEDMELHEMFHGEEKPMHPDTIHITLGKPAEKPVEVKKTEDTPKGEQPVKSQWMPERPAPNWLDKLKKTTKDVCLYALLSLVLFYWQQTGRLEYNTAWYALLLCVGMVFFSIGRNCRGGAK